MKHLLHFALAALLSCGFGFSQSANKELTNSHGEPVDTETERAAFRSKLKAETYDAGFYDNFENLRRYPNNSTITHLVSMPEIGNVYRVSDQVVGHPNYIYGGSLRAGRAGLLYIGSSVATKGDGTFSMGFEFAPRRSYRQDSIFNWSQNVSFNSAEMITAGGGINPNGTVHCNFSGAGITQLNVYGSGITFQGEADDDTLTTSTAHGFLAGELVGVNDDPAIGTQLPSGLPGGSYYAIIVNSTKLKLATSKAAALAGTPVVDLTTDGTSALNTVELSFEPIDRPLSNSGYNFLSPITQVREFQGATSDYLSFTQPHGLANGQRVRIMGGNLPAPLVSGTDYFAITDAFARQLRLATTNANALAGTAIDLTTAGGANQGLYYSITVPGGNAQSLATDRRYCLLVDVKDTILTYTLVGVGSVSFYYRLLPNKISQTSTRWWWEPGGEDLNSGAKHVVDLFAMFAEAPRVRESMIAKFNGGFASQLAGYGPFELPNRLTIMTDQTRLGADGLPNADLKLVLGGASTTALGNNLRVNGGHGYAEGGWLSNVGFANTGGSVLGRAAMTVSTLGGAAYPVSSSAGSQTTLRQFGIMSALENGDSEKWIITGNLVGTAPKRILIDASTYGDVLFDSNRSQSFTAAASDICTSTGHKFKNGDLVQVSTSDTLPAGLGATTDYFVIYLTPDTFKLASNADDAFSRTPVNITSAGSGTHTITTFPLRDINGAYELHLTRQTTASASHCITAKFIMPDGSILPLKRQPTNQTTTYFVLQFKTTTTDAGGVTIDGIERTVSRVVNN